MNALRASLGNTYSKYKTQGLKWWSGREAREQLLLAVMAFFLLIALFWYGLWQPLQNRIDNAQTRVVAQQETLRWVVENTQRVSQLQSAQPTTRQNALGAAELNAFISRTSTEYGLEVSRLQPQSEGVLVVFNEADFDAFLEFLAALDARQVRIDALDLAEASEPGKVRVRRLQVRAGT